MQGLDDKVVQGRVDVQERIGVSLNDRYKVIRENMKDPQLRDQLEQASVMRMIIGDYDDQPNNQTVTRKAGKWLVANIDLERNKGAFDLRLVPPVRRFGVLESGPI